jgi:hypothetical protein
LIYSEQMIKIRINNKYDPRGINAVVIKPNGGETEYCNVAIFREPKIIAIPIAENNMVCRTLLFATKVEAIKKNILKNKEPICFVALKIKI